jgi:hypothetical protein
MLPSRRNHFTRFQTSAADPKSELIEPGCGLGYGFLKNKKINSSPMKNIVAVKNAVSSIFLGLQKSSRRILIKRTSSF